MDITAVIAQELQIRVSQASSAITLLDEGNTVPFISRYRKEATGGLNDEILRSVESRLSALRNLEERRATICSTLLELGVLTPELKRKINNAETMVALEDLYLPYRPKRKTRASIAKEKGLEPLAQWILSQTTGSVKQEAVRWCNLKAGVDSPEDAIAGACDILAEQFAEHPIYRAKIREMTERQGKICASAKDPEQDSVYKMYYAFEEPISKIAGHRVLALNRGEKEKFLQVKLQTPEDEIEQYLCSQIIQKGNHGETAKLLRSVITDAYRRLMAPSMEREIRNRLTEQAEDGAIVIFGKNLKQLLLQPPIAGHVVLGWDPAFRTGCKIAVVDSTGKVLDTTVVFPTAPQHKVAEAKAEIKKLIAKHGVTLISLGNGTASRESEAIIAELIRELPNEIAYLIVNEAGASVYSASELATEEFPNFDVGQRSAISMARRLQDPLAELVKIDPKSVGVGQYQHDMNQKKLDAALSAVVEDCVNLVGVDLNTASASLLSYISGISKTVAKNIVAYREKIGKFRKRKELLNVPKLGPKAFEQCAGFLRISDGEQPLDATAVHPESYSVAERLLQRLGYTKQDLSKGGLPHLSESIQDYAGFAAELSCGEWTLRDIVSELEKPGRDPRTALPEPILRKDVLSLSDLKPGMQLQGTVRNVVDFGAFVDIGVHQDGLVHISQICDRYLKHPLEAVSVGDVVTVRVLELDEARGRISLTMKNV